MLRVIDGQVLLKSKRPMGHQLDLPQSRHPQCQGCDRAERDDIDADGLCTKPCLNLPLLDDLLRRASEHL